MTGLNLRKVIIQKDFSDLYKMMMNDDQYLFSVKISANSEQQFREWLCERLKYDFHDFLIISSEDDKQVIGYAHNYDFSLQDGHCKIAVYLAPEYRDSGIGGFSAIRFMNILFQMYPLQKIYTAVYSYNKRSLVNNIKAGFNEEGFLKQYRYYNGEYHGLHILSIDRKIFYQKFGGILQL